LLHQRGLADLARAGHDLQESTRLTQPGGQDGGVAALKRGRRLGAHYVE